jgi:hypothetical protein
MITGHIAVAGLLHRYLKVQAGPVLIASLYPDIVDKALYRLDLAPSGRTIAHTWLSLAVTTGFVRSIWGGEAAKSWSLGYLGHLLADADGFVPWFFPLRTYSFPQKPKRRFDLLRSLLTLPDRREFLLLSWLLVAVAVQRFVSKRV